MNLILACDIGRRADNTAIAVVERVVPEPPHTDTSQWPTPWKVPGRESVFLVRELGRLSLGTSYVDQAWHIASVSHDARCADPDGTLQLLMDCTGVGEGVGDVLQRYLPSSLTLQRCWFTSTERVERTRGELRVGKPYMISRLTSLLETGRIKLGNVSQRQALVEELRDFEFRVSASGNYQADARSGSHDDLITALGLACLTDGGGNLPPRYKGLPLNERWRPMPVDGDPWEALHTPPW